MNQINAEILASKLTDADFATVAQQPRRREILWFVQWRSWQPGGLQQMAAEILRDFDDRLGTAEMRRQTSPAGAPWTLDQCVAVWKSLDPGKYDLINPWFGEFNNWAPLQDFDNLPGDRAAFGLTRFNRDYFIACCRRRATERLPRYLGDLCIFKAKDLECKSDTNEFHELPNVLLEYMDRHAGATLQALGQNRVTDLVFRRLKYAQTEKYPVMILGDARIGKTRSVSTWCDMRPGLARLVTIPDCNREWEFYAAHADALGLPYNHKTGARALKRTIEYVLKQSGLFIIYDEFQFALPSHYSRNTAPRRLDWIRCQVIDRGIGCAFFATRQTYNTTLEKFVEATRYQMEQWVGRVAPPLILPMEMDHCDIMAAARAAFPATDEDLLGVIVERCIQKESGFRYLQPIAKMAHFNAVENGRTEPNLDDVDAALEEILSGIPNAPQPGAGAAARTSRRKPAPPPPLLREAVAADPAPASINRLSAVSELPTVRPILAPAGHEEP